MFAQYKHRFAIFSTSSLLFFVTLLMPYQVYAATNTVRLYVQPSSTSITVGSTVTLQIRLNKDSNSHIDYTNAIVAYPAQLFEVTTISTSGSYFVENNGPSTTYSNSAGSLQVRGSGATLPTQADVLVASVTFRAKTAGNAAIIFSNNSQAGRLLGGGNVKNYLTSTSSGTIADHPTGASCNTKDICEPSSCSPAAPQEWDGNTAHGTRSLREDKDYR